MDGKLTRQQREREREQMMLKVQQADVYGKMSKYKNYQDHYTPSPTMLEFSS